MQVIISGLECAAALVFTALYLTRVRWHNKREAIPDAQLYLQSALYTAPESGLRSPPKRPTPNTSHICAIFATWGRGIHAFSWVCIFWRSV